MKKFFLMLVIIFISGMISADVCIDMVKDSSVLLDLELYKGYANARLVYQDVFWNVMYERIKLFAFIILLCFTPLRNYLVSLVMGVFSFIWGFFIMSCITELGLAGVVVGITSVLPHGLLYGALVMMLLGGGDIPYSYTYQRRGSIALNVVNVIIMVLLLITGCVMESLVSTHFIPWVIRLSLI